MRARLTAFRRRFDIGRRALLPTPVERPVNVAYELWDFAGYFGVLAIVGYVLNPPSENAQNAQNALSELFDFAAPWQWGTVTAILVAISAICSYREHLLNIGYLLLIFTAMAWTFWFLTGLIVYDAPGRTWISVVIYGAIVSRGLRLKERL